MKGQNLKEHSFLIKINNQQGPKVFTGMTKLGLILYTNTRGSVG